MNKGLATAEVDKRESWPTVGCSLDSKGGAESSYSWGFLLPLTESRKVEVKGCFNRQASVQKVDVTNLEKGTGERRRKRSKSGELQKSIRMVGAARNKFEISVRQNSKVRSWTILAQARLRNQWLLCESYSGRWPRRLLKGALKLAEGNQRCYYGTTLLRPWFPAPVLLV